MAVYNADRNGRLEYCKEMPLKARNRDDCRDRCYILLRDDGTLKVSELKETKNEVAESIPTDMRFAKAASKRQAYELRTLTSAEMTAIREAAASGRLEFFIQTSSECRRKCMNSTRF